uniref:Glutathione S-transferase n=3 Tax=Anoplophora glabripennis TaxID=217634 RepID=A0A8F8MZ07_ANOGL|nr:glutathione S-transferase [Anoplophora glabripennis]
MLGIPTISTPANDIFDGKVRMALDLYYAPGSAPCRIVLLAAKAIGVDLNLKLLNLYEGEHLKPEFLKLNPQHTIPTLVDNGFVIWESRAIITYLQNKYGRIDSLYPKEPKKRAVVDQRLFFDMDFYFRLYQVYNRNTIGGGPPDPEKLKKANESLEFLDTFLNDSEFVAGDHLTLADLSLVVQISNLEVLKHDLSPYKNIRRWYDKVKVTAPGYKEANEDHLEVVREMIEKFSKGNK